MEMLSTYTAVCVTSKYNCKQSFKNILYNSAADRLTDFSCQTGQVRFRLLSVCSTDNKYASWMLWSLFSWKQLNLGIYIKYKLEEWGWIIFYALKGGLDFFMHVKGM